MSYPGRRRCQCRAAQHRIIDLRHADRDRRSTSARSPCARALNYREWSGYYTVSAYEAHHEHEYNAIRNAAALIDVSPLFKYLVTGPRRGAPRRPGHHARRRRRWRSARSSTRRGATSTARSSTTGRCRGWRSRRSAGRPPTRACAGCAQNAAGLDVRDRRHLRAGGRARAAGPDVGARLLRAVADADIDGAAVLPRDQRHDRRRAGRHLAHRLHRRSRLRDLDARGRRALRVWDALMDARPAVRHQAGRHAGARRRARRGRAAADRRRFLQQQEGDDRRRRATRRTRWGSDGWSTSTRRAFIGQQALAARARARPAAPGRRPRGRLDRGRGALRDGSACAPAGARDRVARRRCRSTAAAARSAARRPRPGRRR